MKLTVLQVTYPLAPVGVDAVGGAEQVLTWLDAALVAAGHRSIVVAYEGSTAAGTLQTIAGGRGRRLTDELRHAAQNEQRQAILDALRRWQIDLIHIHGFDFDSYLPEPDIPVLVTLHLPAAWYRREAFFLERPRTYLHCVSQSQQSGCPKGARLLPPIENGVPTDLLSARHAKRHFALALGRICPEKGFHLALEAAARARSGVVIAGEVFGYEALACGTPVIAFSAGALAEIIEHGKTGFLVHDVSEMAEAIAQAHKLDREVCRETARVRFSLDRMTAEYLERYARLVAGWNATPSTGALVSRLESSFHNSMTVWIAFRMPHHE